ncbi:MAG: molybdenum cofactor guanylyltransferase [Spirochaetes bacterium]|nr:molybdenum cofactor guanylyltransferase [Spirochaetota bacterium]
MHSNDISAFIIAGGKSSRFGEDKAVFLYHGKPLIEHVIEAIRPVFNRIAIIGDDAEKFDYLGLPSHRDIVPGIGPLGGLYTALRVADTGRIFIFACDMPGLNTGLIRHMIELSENVDVVIPFIGGFYEPLHAIYSKSCIAPMETLIQEGKRQIFRFFDQVTVRQVTADEIRAYADPEAVFRNINYRIDAEQ